MESAHTLAAIGELAAAHNQPDHFAIARKSKKGPEGPFAPKACRPWVIGAGDGIRTHDPNLGKVMLYP